MILDRPIVFFDAETTGVNPHRDRVIELATIRWEAGTILGQHAGVHTHWLLNPGVPIPPAATAVHHLTDQDVQACPVFRDVAHDIALTFRDADLGGFGIDRFDCALLEAEFRRTPEPFSLGGRRIVDVLSIYHAHERRDLEAAVRFYLEEPFPEAHRALADVDATVRVFLAQLTRYQLPRSVDALDVRKRAPHWLTADGKVAWSDGAARFTFGPALGLSLQDAVKTARSFCEWVLRKDFPDDLKALLREALCGRFPDDPTAHAV
jgi:DNA polymerase III subunit epsilon